MKPIHQRFADGMAEGLSLRQAALKAGCPESSASNNATRWMRDNEVKARIARKKRVINKAAEKISGVDKAYLVCELIDNSNQAKALDNPDYKASNQSISIAAKLLGYMIDKSEVVISSEVKDFIEDVISIIDDEITDPAMMERVVERIMAKLEQ